MDQKRIVILHIANLHGNLCSGVNNVVPKYVERQNKYADAFLFNVHDVTVNETIFETLTPPFNTPDIVIFHEAHEFKYIRLYKICLQKRIPYVIVPHGELSKYCQRQKWLKKKIADALFFNRFFSNANAFHFLSDSERDNTKHHSKFFVLPNGIEEPGNPSILKAPSNPLVFFFLGRVAVYIKGIDLLIKAVASVKERLVGKCKLHIYGPLDKRNRRIVEALLRKYEVGELIVFKGPVFGDAKEKVLNEGDVCCLCSRTEGSPIAALEAFSHGKPCLVTKGTGLDRIVGEYNSGWVCESSPDGIASGLLKAIDEKELFQDKYEASLRVSKEVFSWDSIAKRAVDCYTKVINGAL